MNKKFKLDTEFKAFPNEESAKKFSKTRLIPDVEITKSNTDGSRIDAKFSLKEFESAVIKNLRVELGVPEFYE